MMKILNEMKDMVFILLVTGVFSWVANLINIHPDLGASAIGVFLLEAFKALSWRIIPVALAVAAGSFICATVLAEIMLGLEGVF